MQRGNDLFQADRFTEAEAVFREALAIRPDNLHACWSLGTSLLLGGKNEDAIVVVEQFLKQLSPNGPSESRNLIVAGLAGRSIAYSHLGRLEAAAKDLEQVSEYIGPEAPADVLRTYYVVAHCAYSRALADADRLEESIAALHRVTEHVRPDDLSEMRHIAALALLTKGQVLSRLEQPEDAIGAWDQATAYVRREDPVELRSVAVHAQRNIGKATLPVEIGPDTTLDSFEGSSAAGESMAEYVRSDDPAELRDRVAGLLSRIGMLRNVFGDFGGAEIACKKATDIDPSHAESWRVRAEAILGQEDDARLSEAEDYARRAVGLTPENAIAARTLAEILACLEKWTGALNWLEKSLLDSGEELPQSRTRGLAEPLIRAVAAGHGKRVRRLMEEASLAEPMEPLWHAVRAELGEELEPLPAEIVDTVKEIRSRFSKA